MPQFPDHAAAMAGIVTSEAGGLMDTCLNWKYSRPGSIALQENILNTMRKQAVQAAAASIRFLENIDKLKPDAEQAEEKVNGLL